MMSIGKKYFLKFAKGLALFFVGSVLGEQQFQILTQSTYTEKLGYGDWNINTDGESLLMKQLIKPQSIVFDVGGNLGEWTALALQCESSAHIITFEPVPEAYQRLKNIFNTNDRVTLFNVACSNKNGSSHFYYYSDKLAHWGLSGFYYREVLHGDLAEPEVISVPHQTIDDFCMEHSISEIAFLKIDTEGSEWNILLGSDRMLGSHKIRAIQFEYGGCYVDAKTTLKQVMQYLTDKHYVIFRIFSNGLIHIPRWEDTLENYDLCNYCALCKEDAHGYNVVSFDE